MKKFLIILLLLTISLSSSGCLLRLAALIGWDRKNYEKQQKSKEIKKENKKVERENEG